MVIALGVAVFDHGVGEDGNGDGEEKGGKSKCKRERRATIRVRGGGEEGGEGEGEGDWDGKGERLAGECVRGRRNELVEHKQRVLGLVDLLNEVGEV